MDYGVPSDGVGFVQAMYNLSRHDAIRKVWKDIVLESEDSLKPVRIEYPVKLDYEYMAGDLKEFELTYWRTMFIDKELLDFYQVRSLVSLRRAGKLMRQTKEDNPEFIYLFKERSFKTYRPYGDPGDKFRGQRNGKVLEGYNQLPPYGKILIVTSSLKDVIVLRNLGYYAIAPSSETSWRYLVEMAPELSMRFEHIFILFDPDRAGIESATKVHKLTFWEILLMPYRITKEVKDSSDWVTFDESYYNLDTWIRGVLKEKIS